MALAEGLDISDVGPSINVQDCIQLDLPKTQLDEHGITGRVIHIDRFGNVQTTITSGNISMYQPSSFSGIFIGKSKVTAISSTYSDFEEGELLAVIDSAGHLEIAVNKGNAAKQIGCKIGDPVTLVMEREEE